MRELAQLVELRTLTAGRLPLTEMTEPDVALTDYALAIECTVFCILALRRPSDNARLQRWWVVLFASIGTGSLLGGTVHGFFNSAGTGNAVLWRATLLTLGVASMSMWLIGALIQLREPAVTWVRRAAVAQLIVYAAVVLFVDSHFYVAIATYLPATVFLLIVLIVAYRRARSAALASGIVGLSLTFVAAAVQQLHIALHPVYFNHNAFYHVLQGIALYLLFRTATTQLPSDW